jgi:hypothetical protein
MRYRRTQRSTHQREGFEVFRWAWHNDGHSTLREKVAIPIHYARYGSIPYQPSVVFSTLFATMAGRLTAPTTRGGRGRGYRPGTMTFDNPMALVPEGTNENGPTEIDNPISIRMEFTPTANTPIVKVLSSFLDALSKADHLASLICDSPKAKPLAPL